MNKPRLIEWFDMETFESVGLFPIEQTDDCEELVCPRCGGRTTYWEGQIEEDPRGGAIYGYCHDCYPCHIHSAVKELP